MKRSLFSLFGVSLLALSVFGVPVGSAVAAVTGWSDEPAKTEPAQNDPAKTEPTKSEPEKTEPAKTDPAKADPAQPASKSEPKKEESVPAEAKVYYVKLTTSMGDIVIELDNQKAPISTKNFLSYVDKKHYDGTIFHRVIPGFMIQGGNFKPDMIEKKTDAPIKNEWKNGLKNKRGTLSMARTQVADSATSQFFLNVADNDFLDTPRDGAAYAVFGRVVSGMDVADKIVAVPSGRKGMHENVPKTPITIDSATRLSEEDAQKLLPADAAKK